MSKTLQLPLGLKTFKKELIGKKLIDNNLSTSFIITDVKKNKFDIDGFELWSENGVEDAYSYKVLESLVLTKKYDNIYYLE